MLRFNTFSELQALTAGKKIYIKLAGAAGFLVKVSKTDLQATARSMKKYEQNFAGSISLSHSGSVAQITLD